MYEKQWLEKVKDKFPGIKLEFSILQTDPIRGNTWGSMIGRYIISTDKVRVLFTYDDFHGGCGIGTIYKYGVTNPTHGTDLSEEALEEGKQITLSILSFIADRDKRGALLACNPLALTYEKSFLYLAEFVPLIGWGNPLHLMRGLHLWIKIYNEPMEPEAQNNISSDAYKTCFDTKTPLYNLLNNKV